MTIVEVVCTLALAAAVILLVVSIRLIGRRLTRLEQRVDAIDPALVPACRMCGCTDDQACWPGGCFWVEPDLCSSCAPDVDGSSFEDEG